MCVCVCGVFLFYIKSLGRVYNTLTKLYPGAALEGPEQQAIRSIKYFSRRRTFVMCIVCNERKSSKSRDVSIDDLKRSRSPLGPHRSKLVIICLTFSLLLDLWWSG